jgi:hypothetical protein
MISATRARRSAALIGVCVARTSSICSPQRITGFSAVEQHPPAAGPELGRQQSHRRLRDHRFSRARFPDQADDLAGGDVEADPVDGVRAFGADRQRDRETVDFEQHGSHT